MNFSTIVKNEPKWLGGIVYGPQTRLPLPQLRAAIPAKYPIRHYPDITHSRHCQYPVPDWDTAFALTEGREIDQSAPDPDGTHLSGCLQPHTVGFITYSEGCNDDVNKIVWSALGWDPDADVVDILREYGRYFIGPQHEDALRRGCLRLEQNWVGPVATNRGIDANARSSSRRWNEMPRPQEMLNWRFQQGLYRAYYDAYVRSRSVYETALGRPGNGPIA